MRIFAISTIILAAALTGCTTKNYDAHRFISEKHLKREVPNDVTKLKGTDFYNSYVEAIGSNAGDKEFSEFLNEGVLLTRYQCLSSLNDIVDDSRNASYSKDQFLLTTLLLTGFMGVNGASSESFEKFALGTAFVVSSSELFQNYYLLGPDAPKVLELVERALDTQEEYAKSQSIANFQEAARLLYDYASVCTSAKVDSLVAESISQANIVPPEAKPADLAFIKATNRILGINNITLDQLSALHFVTVKGTDQLDSNEKIKAYIDDSLKAKVKSNFEALQALFLSFPQKVIASLSENFDYFSQEKQNDADGNESFVNVFTGRVSEELTFKQVSSPSNVRFGTVKVDNNY